MRTFMATLLVLSIASVAAASSKMRCGSELVSVGDSTAQVLLQCGEPMTRERVALESSGSTEKLVELWTYAFGPGQFLKLLTFEAGKLAAIESGERQ